MPYMNICCFTIKNKISIEHEIVHKTLTKHVKIASFKGITTVRGYEHGVWRAFKNICVVPKSPFSIESFAHILYANSLKSIHKEINLRAMFRSIFIGLSIAIIDKSDRFNSNS